MKHSPALIAVSLALFSLACGDGSVGLDDTTTRAENGPEAGADDAATEEDNTSSEGEGANNEDENGGDEGSDTDNDNDADDTSDSTPPAADPDPLQSTLEQLCQDGIGNRGNRIFVEVDQFLVMEAEDAYYDGPEDNNWIVQTEESGFSDRGYYEWFNPANTHGGGFIARSSQLWFNVYISTPGTYIVSVRGRINQGENDSEHNDVWLRVAGGVADFYSFRRQADQDLFRRPADIADSDGVGESLAASRGYLKAYNKTVGRWSYETRNVDFREANIFAVFDEPGLYNVSLAGKVRGFGIDQVVLIGDPAWHSYNRLTNRAGVLNETEERRHHDCE